MLKQQIEERKAGLFGVVGDISFESVVDIEKEGLVIITGSESEVALDLSHVQLCSSAAMALLLSWVRHAAALQKNLVFVGVPASLMTMIEGAQLQSVINVQA